MIFLFSGAALISFAAVFVRLAQVGPDTAAFYRMFFGTIALVFLLWRDGSLRRIKGRMVGYALLCGLLFALDIMSWHRSIHYVGPGLATLLTNFQVFALTVVSLLVLHERPGRLFYLALPLAFVGLYLMVGVHWDSVGDDYQAGVGWGFLTALFYAAYVLGLKLSIPRLGGPGRKAFMTCVAAATGLIIGCWMLVSGVSFVIPTAMDFMWLAALGVLCQAAGWLFISRGMEGLSATLVGLGLLLQPALSYLWDILFFGKPFGVTDGIGAVLALGGIYMGVMGTRPSAGNRKKIR